MKTFTGYELSQDKPLSYQMIAQWIRRVGEILGLEYPTIPYNLRYNAANEFDRSGSSSPPITIALLLTPASADISESLRNLALDHANSNPFQKHYLGREVCADTWGILRRQKPQQALIRQACSVGHSISKRRPTDLTAEQIASVSTDPIIKRLEQDLRHHRPGSKKHMELRRRLRNEKQRLKRVLKQKIRDEWTARQAVDDIEGNCKRPAQKRLVEALAAPLGNTLEGQYRRRDNAIAAIVAYCMVEEGQTIRGARASVDSTRPTLMNEPPINSPQHTALMSTFIKTVTDRPRRCFICVGKALDLTSDDGAVEVLIREFYTPGDLSKHFRRKHLSNLREGDEIRCSICDLPLDHMEHLRNHALRIHGTQIECIAWYLHGQPASREIYTS
ncbi:C2H2 finger domain protein [Hirsutella rhossiliensis]